MLMSPVHTQLFSSIAFSLRMVTLPAPAFQRAQFLLPLLFFLGNLFLSLPLFRLLRRLPSALSLLVTALTRNILGHRAI